jgi:hypothetical protein
VFDAFVQGLTKHGQQVVEHDITADVAVIWSVLWNGRMRPAQEIFNSFQLRNKPVVVLEIGCLERDQTWKIGVNGVNMGHFEWARSITRPHLKKISLHPDKITGDVITICTQNHMSEQWRNQPITVNWLENTISNVRKFSHRPIHIRAHPRVPMQFNMSKHKNVTVSKPNPLSNERSLIESLSNTRFLINHNSNPAIIAALWGIPVHVDQSSLAYPVSNVHLANIETPTVYDKTEWLSTLLQTEYTTDEMRQADVIDHLLRYLKSNYQLL